MHIERTIEQLKSEVVSLRGDIAISRQLSEIKDILVDIRERLTGMSESDVAEVEERLRQSAEKLADISQEPRSP